METTLICVALIIGGSLVYGSNDQAGALLIAAGVAVSIIRWVNRVLFKNT